MKISGFRDLKVWQNGKTLVLTVYRQTGIFPKDEIYGLTSQMRRSSISIPSNIAEGYNRFYKKEYCRFLYIALGSCAELETQIEISRDLKFINDNDYNELLELVDCESRMLKNLITKLKQ